MVFACLAFELCEVAQQSAVITGDFRLPVGPYQKQLSIGLKKTSHTNYVLTKVTGWNFLKKNSSVSYREAGRLKPF